MRSRSMRFLAHYLEMVAAMLVGMMLLYPVWMLATWSAGPTHPLRGPEAETLAMATTMAIGMAVWMRHRGHDPRHIAEMSAAMYAGFVVVYPAMWWAGMNESDLMTYGHLLMLALMAVPMVRHGRRHVTASDARPRQPSTSG
ncbi:hypothetical protein [Solicola gregarius]|uniref:Flagellar biosynthetic protein FliP n=1 Tax=Solicola gregarius TaxID=2908642 RepID=A0AA46TKU6_9ACTN|nr:hypothetical protein [Solicola gregarius]UYM06935.1 hypothetical protein L0C25_07625 [Solicola gregarius]